MPVKPKISIVGLAFFAICLIANLQACSTGRSGLLDAESIKDQPGPESVKNSKKTISGQNPTIVSLIGELELTVRMATQDEIQKDNYSISLLSIPIGASFVALGVTTPLMFPGPVVLGGALMIPLGTINYLHQKGIWDPIEEALRNVEFTRAIDSAIKDRLNITFTEENIPNVKIEIIIQAFGIVNSSSMPHRTGFFSTAQQHCFILSAHFLLSTGNMELVQDYLRITESNRSEDAPPPQCASLERFAKDEARLLTDTLAEAAEVLAVMVTDRIPRENSK